MFWDGTHYRVFATEGGHVISPPASSWKLIYFVTFRLTSAATSVMNESSPVLAWSSLQFLKDTGRGEEPAWLSDEMAHGVAAAAISSLPREEARPMAEQALDIWVSIYGAEAGNLALKIMAMGGVYLGGGIAPKIIQNSLALFSCRPSCQGPHAAALETIPVRVITNDKIALLGAAVTRP